MSVSHTDKSLPCKRHCTSPIGKNSMQPLVFLFFASLAFSAAANAESAVPQYVSVVRVTDKENFSIRFSCRDAGENKIACAERDLTISHYRERLHGKDATPEAICAEHLSAIPGSHQAWLELTKELIDKAQGSERLALEIRAACLRKNDLDCWRRPKTEPLMRDAPIQN